MESGLQGSQPIVLQHMQECLYYHSPFSAEVQIEAETETHRLSCIVKTQEQNFGVLVHQTWENAY